MAKFEAKSEVTGDESVPYENWKEFEKAVEEGKELIPELPKQKRISFIWFLLWKFRD